MQRSSVAVRPVRVCRRPPLALLRSVEVRAIQSGVAAGAESSVIIRLSPPGSGSPLCSHVLCSVCRGKLVHLPFSKSQRERGSTDLVSNVGFLPPLFGPAKGQRLGRHEFPNAIGELGRPGLSPESQRTHIPCDSDHGKAPSAGGLSAAQARRKRSLDLLLAVLGLSLTGWLIALAWLLATLDTRENEVFLQQRVGRNGRLFNLIKIRTMRRLEGVDTTVTTSDDPRITRLGAFLRRWKIDELPQLANVLLGDMSFVGPRPDVPGFADRLSGDDRLMLTLRPGITGPATLKYRDEESLLARQPDPEYYNRDVIFPDKVRINLRYMARWRLREDLRYILLTAIGK